MSPLRNRRRRIEVVFLKVRPVCTGDDLNECLRVRKCSNGLTPVGCRELNLTCENE